MTVRAARAGDEVRLAELNGFVQEMHREREPTWFKPVDGPATALWFHDRIASEDAYVLVDDESGTLAGYVLARVVQMPDTALTYAATVVELDQISVDPVWRGRGVGQDLINSVKALASEVQADRLQLTVWEFNEHAQTVFLQAGFTTATRRMFVTP